MPLEEEEDRINQAIELKSSEKISRDLKTDRSTGIELPFSQSGKTPANLMCPRYFEKELTLIMVGNISPEESPCRTGWITTANSSKDLS